MGDGEGDCKSCNIATTAASAHNSRDSYHAVQSLRYLYLSLRCTGLPATGDALESQRGSPPPPACSMSDRFRVSTSRNVRQ